MSDLSKIPLRVGDWCVNPATGQISRPGETVRVEARTMRLLLHLAARAGEVVSIDELLDQVWSGVIVTPDSVYQAIASLRRLLKDDARQPAYIATVPRLGYRLVAAVAPWTEEQAPPPSPPQTPQPRRHLARWAVAAMLLLLAGAGLLAARDHARRPPAVAATQNPQSIGVLPFLDLTAEMDQEYFADGMTEELIDRLSRVPGLRVPARTSSFYFKGRQATIAEVSRTLGVAYVLEGSVRKSGRMLRVTAQLIRAGDGYHLWSDTYDRPLDDILAVQDDIAAEVQKALLASIEDAARPPETASASPAYPLYFQARTLLRGDPDEQQAQAVVDDLRQALRLDPGYAPAWAELARALAYQSYYRLGPAAGAAAEAHQAAARALALDPRLAEAHLSLGVIRCFLDWDWAGAEREYREVLALRTGDAEAFAFLSQVRAAVGGLDEARSLMQQAATLDPLDARYYQLLGQIDYSLGQLDRAQADFRKALDIDGSLPLQAALGEIGLARGDAPAALELMRQETDEPSRVEGLALAYFALGRRAEADAQLAQLKSGSAGAFAVARVLAYRKDPDQAFAWLERARQQHDPDCIHAAGDPLLKTLAGDGRYKLFLRNMGVPM